MNNLIDEKKVSKALREVIKEEIDAEVSKFIEANNITCDPPCPEHLCRYWSQLGICGLQKD